MGNTEGVINKIPEYLSINSPGFYLWAILIGVFLSVVVNMGPAFITLVQTSLHRGARSAAWFALGVILNDALIISLCILTSVKLVVDNSKIDPNWFCIGAGVILVLFGVFTFRKKVQDLESIDEETGKTVVVKSDVKPKWYVFLGKGFVLNILNPFVWIFWFSSVAVVAGKMDSRLTTLVFFGVILGTTLTVELLKAWGAARLKRFLNPKRTTIINRTAGIMLVVCGLYFIILEGIVKLISTT